MTGMIATGMQSEIQIGLEVLSELAPESQCKRKWHPFPFKSRSGCRKCEARCVFGVGVRKSTQIV